MKFAVLSGLSFVVFLAWLIARIILGIQFDIGCGDYISRAATSPDPSIAASQLDAAIAYADQHNFTSGNTGVFFTYPTNDVGFWHKRLTDSRTILHALPLKDSPLEISNTMMRVRETLVEGGKNGDYLVTPQGISIFPSNVAFFWWGALSLLMTVLFAVWGFIELDNE